MGISPLLEGYFPEGSFVWLTFCYSVGPWRMIAIAVWRRMAIESIAKRVIVKGAHDIIPNYVAGGMDATDGTYVWNHVRRGCPEEEWEELYKGRLGILEDKVITLNRLAGQRAWLKLGKRVTVCGRRMCSTHLQNVYVEWSRPQRARGVTKKHETGMELPEGP